MASKMCSSIILICIFYWILIPFSMGINIDTNFPMIYDDAQPQDDSGKSYFGYSVILQPSGNESGAWIQIGAPRGTSQNNNTGNVFRCPIGQKCHKIIFGSDCPGSDGDWVGGAMDVQFVDKPGYVVACGHRWLKSTEPIFGTYFMSGVCYLMSPTTKEESFTHVRNRCLNPIYNRNRFIKDGLYELGLGQAGASVHFPRLVKKNVPDLMVGAPGVLNWQGAIALVVSGNPVVPMGDKSWGLGEFNMFGYQVNSGHFFSKENILYVASGPKHKDLVGCVILFSMNSRANKASVIATTTGRTFGEYFGASLAVGDFNGDGYDDLIVGAPQYSRVSDEGCIYTFYGKKDGTDLVIPQQDDKFQITGIVSGSRFGTTAMSLGDIDYDGYDDLAVGAPYEDDNRGAVYIYNGRQGGLESRYSQRILAKKVADGLRGFGISIARPADVDDNHYKDLAVGSYLSGHAVLFRAYPVVTLGQSLTSSVTKIKSGSTSFSVMACINYKGLHVPKNIRVNRTLTVDIAHRRAHLGNLYNSSQRIVQNIVLNETDNYCEEFDIQLKPNMTHNEILNPIEIRLFHQLPVDDSIRKEVIWINNTQSGETVHDGFCKTCPVETKDQLHEETLNIPLAANCTDDICNSDLQLICEFPYMREKTFVIGSSKSIELHLEVQNKNESAYETRLIVHIPFPVQLDLLPSNCEKRKEDNKDFTAYDCYIDNKLDAGIKKLTSLKLDMTAEFSSGQRDKGVLQFYAQVQSLSEEIEELDNSCDLSLTLTTEADITIVGKLRSQATYAYKQAEVVANTSIEFVHDYEVQKFGDSPIEQVFFEVEFPTGWLTNQPDQTDNFLRIYKPEGSQSNQPLTCSSTVNEETYLKIDRPEETDSNLREKRSNKESPAELIAQQQLQANQTFFINCSTPNIKCSTVSCTSRPFQGNSVARLSIHMAIDISKIVPLMGTKNIIQLSSQGHVKIQSPLGFKQTHKFNNKPDDAIVETRIIGSVSKQELANWVIPASIGGGLLLLFLLIMTLIKAGFFQRKKKIQLEALISADAEEKEDHRRSQMLNPESLDSDMDPSG